MKLLLKSFMVFISVVTVIYYLGSLFQAIKTENINIILPMVNLGIGGIVVGCLFTSFILLNKIKE